MIIVVRHSARSEDVAALTAFLTAQGVTVTPVPGERSTLLAVVGDTSRLDDDRIAGFAAVEAVRRITEPLPLAGRGAHPADSVVEVGGVPIGGGHFALIAGPCSVEGRTQLLPLAASLRAAGADLLRGGAYKPRTSPYHFQGLGKEGLALLREAREATGLPIVTEIVDPRQLPLFEDVDLIQVGARNMQNFELLKELGRIETPVLLKRGPAATLKELLLAAEYILSGGNGRVILCERGVRSFDTATRYLLDLSAVAVLHERTHLPVIVDPSHAAGAARYVPSLSLAAVAAGADGLMLEVHADPSAALSDGAQALLPENFAALAKQIQALRAALTESGD